MGREWKGCWTDRWTRAAGRRSTLFGKGRKVLRGLEPRVRGKFMDISRFWEGRGQPCGGKDLV